MDKLKNSQLHRKIYNESRLLLRDNKYSYFVTLLLCVIENIFVLFYPLIYKKIVDNSITLGNLQVLSEYIILLVIILILHTLVSILSRTITINFTKTIKELVNKWAFKTFLYRNSNNKDYETIFINDIPVYSRVLSEYLFVLPVAFIGIAVSVFVLMLENVFLGIILFIVNLLIVLIQVNLNSRVRVTAIQARKSYGVFANVLLDFFQKGRMLPGIGALKYALNENDKSLTAYLNSEKACSKKAMHLQLLNEMISELMQIALIFLYGYMIYHKHISVGSVIIFLNYSSFLQNTLSQIIDVNMSIENSALEVENVADILANRYDAIEKCHCISIVNEISAHALSISYGLNDIIKESNFMFKKGTVNCIIGKNGVGKSTLFSVLSKQNLTYEGQILLEKEDFTNLNIEDINTYISLIPQQPQLFNNTVYNNISFGLKCDDKRLNELCELLSFDVEKIHLNASALSIGEKQKISIIRALMKDSHVYLFDEITANLDQKTSKIVINQMNKLATNRIVVFITHDHSFIQERWKVFEINEHGEIYEK